MEIINRFDPTTQWNGINGNWSPAANRKIKGIALHKTGFNSDTLEGVINWFHNRNSMVSSNYVVGPLGQIVCVVPEQHVSYATGGSKYADSVWRTPAGPVITGYAVNVATQSIEVTGASGQPYTAAELPAVKELVLYLCRKYDILPAWIFPHRQVQIGKSDGAEHLDEIRAYIKKELEGGGMDVNFETNFRLWFGSGGVAVNPDAGIYQALREKMIAGKTLSPPLTDETSNPIDPNIVVQWGQNWRAEYNKSTNQTKIVEV